MRAYIPAHNSAYDHRNPLLPVNRSCNDECHHSHTVYYESHYAFKSVHAMDIGHAEHRKHGKHDNSHASAEIASIYRHRKLKNRCSSKGSSSRVVTDA